MGLLIDNCYRCAHEINNWFELHMQVCLTCCLPPGQLNTMWIFGADQNVFFFFFFFTVRNIWAICLAFVARTQPPSSGPGEWTQRLNLLSVINVDLGLGLGGGDLRNHYWVSTNWNSTGHHDRGEKINTAASSYFHVQEYTMAAAWAHNSWLHKT